MTDKRERTGRVGRPKGPKPPLEKILHETEERINRVKKMHRRGLTPKEIANKIGVDTETAIADIAALVVHHDIPPTPRGLGGKRKGYCRGT